MGVVLKLLRIVTFSLIFLRTDGYQNKTDNLCKNVVCDLYCPYGNVIDSKGCKTCNCINPCANVTCPIGEECKIKQSECKQELCRFTATCSPECPLYKCLANCPYGYEVDINGCRTCNCIDHCKNHICEQNQTCVMEHLCPIGTCGIKPKCIKECPSFLPCHLTARCAYGFEVDSDNCPTCACRNPCGGVVCPSDQFCSVTVLNCLVAPCPPPSAECHSYCADESALLTDYRKNPLSCTSDSSICPKGYKCHFVSRLQSSYCCSI